MGKFRAHHDKNRRGRGKSRLKKKGYTEGGAQKGGVVGTSSRANGHGRPDEQHKGGHADVDETVVSVSGAEAGGGGARKKKPRHVTYGKEHSVLICGDGDFSFTRGVIRHRGTGVGVVATSLDSRSAVFNKYPHAESWLAQLDEDGAQVIHGVDATRLPETLLEGSGGKIDNAGVSSEPAAAAAAEGGGGGGGNDRKHVLFDRVVFNFPHTGKQRTHLNRNLIRDFFSSTRSFVKCAADGGEIHVTLKNKRPYSDWNVRAMAKESGLVMVRSLLFDASVFPGYCHSTTDPKAKEFDAVGAKTHVFCRGRSALDDNVEAPGVFPRIVKTTDTSGNGARNGSAQVTPKLADIDGKCSDFNGGNDAGRAAQKPAETTLTDVGVDQVGEEEEEEEDDDDDDFDADLLNALCDEDDEENGGDGWNVHLGGKVEGGVGVSTSHGDGGLTGRSVSGESRDSVLSPSSSEAGPTSGRCKDKSTSKSTRRTQRDGCLGVRGGQGARVGGGERGGRALGAAAGGKGQRDKNPVTDKAARVLEDPLLLLGKIKRKAEKRRALRKKAAATRKAAAASAAGVEVSSAGTSIRESAMKDAPASSHAKRKRGKYVRAAKKGKVGGNSPSPT